jgi:hypothetical protein
MNRKELRQKLLVDVILGQENELVFQAYFDGYGDSGNVHTSTGNADVDEFLAWCVDKYVKFDWYNNEGGGGDITWEVQTDKVTINGYYNVTQKHDVMVEEEF